MPRPNPYTLWMDLDGLLRFVDDPDTHRHRHTATPPIVDMGAFEVQASGMILHAPGDYPTIQAAIDAASDGDTVAVADGIHRGEGNKALDFHGKAITVRSLLGEPTSCIIDCEYDSRGVLFQSGEGPDSAVIGIKIWQGYAGGVLLGKQSDDLELHHGAV